MCGIAGILRIDGGPVERRGLDAMADALAHRGPDDSGVWTAGAIGLANRRLAIIGLGPQGHQPMYDATGRVAITHNGEIYNYRELRAELAAAGHEFRTDTDTEVILEAYLAWGIPSALERLNGMFAFAIWDEPEQRLVLARDRLGIKPLYVERSATRLAFASELNALAAAREGTPAIDDVALDAYFAVGYVPAPRTIWRSVSAVMPGSSVVVDGTGERVHRYWRLRPDVAEAPRTAREAAERVRAAVERAVRRQLTSHELVGIFLSGGIDSAAIAAVAARLSPTVEAITVRFGERDFDEDRAAARTAAHLGIPHHVETVRPDLWPTLPRLAAAYGQPFADSSALATYALAGAARARMTVALSGDGGDELFGGYPTYLASALVGPYRRLPAAVRGMLRSAAARLPIEHARVGLSQRATRFVAAAEEGMPGAHLRWREHFDAPTRARLLGRAVEQTAFASAIEESAAFRGADRYLALDVLAYLPNDMLCKVDIASMRHGLEVRPALLDHELVELAFSIPHGMKRDAFQGKKVLRAAFADALPASVRRGPKRGFNVPVARWLAGPMYPMAREVLDPAGSRAMRLLDGALVARLLEEHRTRRRDNGHRLWSLLVFCLWYESTVGAVVARG